MTEPNPAYFLRRSAEAYERADFFTEGFFTGGVEAALWYENGWRCLAVRGTQFNFNDILRDLRGVPWCDPALGWCHSGFLKGADALWPQVAPYLRAAEPVHLTGHSIGGAVATVLAARMTLVGQPPASLVTFGCPRVGFARLGRRLADVPGRRFVCGDDAAPAHPWALWGFRHVRAPDVLPGGAGRWDDHRLAAYRDALDRSTG